MSDPKGYFGLSCPSGGKFYICEDAETEFVGCCTSDPCSDGKGTCPDDDLRVASFSGDSYEDIPPQDCDDPRGSEIWFTCKFNSPPFMGCCDENPCAKGSCARSKVVPAMLSDDTANRERFLQPDDEGTATGTSGSATATASSDADSDDGGSGGLGTGATAGIAVGAAVVGLFLLAGLIWLLWWKPRQKKKSGQEFQSVPPAPTMSQQPPDTPGFPPHPDMAGQQSPMTNYQPSFASSPVVAPYYPSGVSSMDQYAKYSPQTAQFDRPPSFGNYSDNGAAPPGYMQQQYTGTPMAAVQEMDATPTVVQELSTGQEHSIPQSPGPDQQRQQQQQGLGISK
ncbi:hypothetical protein ACJ41O_000934 [Fusarium nematophilum]